MKLKSLNIDEIKELKPGDKIYTYDYKECVFEELKHFSTSFTLIKVKNSDILLNPNECFIIVSSYDESYPVELRDYIGGKLRIDGRQIPYRISTAYEYLFVKGIVTTEEAVELWIEENEEAYKLLNQIIALKQSCFLLRYTTYSCGSLSDDLYDLKLDFMMDLKKEYGIEFDDLVETYK